MQRRFDSKEAARRAVWRELQERRAARFPFPVEGRIPNFAGAERAAAGLLEMKIFQLAKHVKVNPDSPQKPVRAEALRRGITVFVPTPRLRGGFQKLDPAEVPDEEIDKAAALSAMDEWAVEVPLEKMPQVDVIVTGSVAITRDGRRCGKGHGYGDLEYAILRELGHDPPPVATTVHPLQIVDDFPADEHDLPVSLIATPDEVIEVSDPPAVPCGLDWERISGEMLREMPVLEELRKKIAD